MPEWTWERLQWKSTLHSPKLQHNWNLTMRLFSVISSALFGGVLPLCRVAVFCSTSRLGYRTFVGGVLPLCKEAVRVFCCPNWLDHGTLVVGVLPLCRYTVGVFCCPSRRDQETLVGGVLALCRDEVGVFCCPSRLGHGILVGGGLTPLQRSSQCILQAQPNGLVTKSKTATLL